MRRGYELSTERINERKAELCIGVTELAMLCGVSLSTAYRWTGRGVDGTIRLTDDHASILAKVLQTSIAELSTETE